MVDTLAHDDHVTDDGTPHEALLCFAKIRPYSSVVEVAFEEKTLKELRIQCFPALILHSGGRCTLLSTELIYPSLTSQTIMSNYQVRMLELEV